MYEIKPNGGIVCKTEAEVLELHRLLISAPGYLRRMYTCVQDDIAQIRGRLEILSSRERVILEWIREEENPPWPWPKGSDYEVVHDL